MFLSRASILSIISKRHCERAVDGHELETNQLPAPSDIQKYHDETCLNMKPELEDYLLRRVGCKGTAYS